MKFFDFETCGFHGPAVLLQYAEGVDGEIKLHSIWKESIGSTLDIFDSLIYDSEGIVGFNVAFDWFHLCQMYTTLLLIPRDKWDDPPDVAEYALLEPKGRFGPCIKPTKCLDLMLHARKGPYQSTMNRDDIRIKKVPTPLAWQLADELEKRIALKDIYFARKKEQGGRRWQIYDIEGADGKVNPDFKDLVLKFAPSSALKALAADALEIDPNDILKFKDIELPRSYFPNELGYAPYALAIGTPENWDGAWPEKIRHHIGHWAFHPTARDYAKLDVEYLQRLWMHFGCPELGDDDSELSCMVAAVRWRGFSVDVAGLKKLKEAALKRNMKMLTPEEAKGIPFLDSVPGKPGYKYLKIPTAPHTARAYIKQALGATELVVEGNDNLEATTKKAVLEEMVKSKYWRIDCESCGELSKDGTNPCTKCGGKGWTLHPAAQRAKDVLDARQAAYEADFYDKLILAGRFHASSSVTGARSGRMSGGGSARGIEGGGRAGGDKLNPQGVKRTKEVRQQFPLADGILLLCGGDFSGFEVCLAEAVYNDELLRADLMSGKKIHGLFGQFLFPHLTYDQIVASAGTAEDYYEKSKRSFFAVIYGAEAKKLQEITGRPIEECIEALIMFGKRYPGVGRHRQKINEMFCSMRQPGGIGSVVEWHEPSDFIESRLGFRRYFTLENSICKALYNLANDPPKPWLDVKIRVVRRDRLQTASGAVRSALFAAAFGLQAGNMRAAANHEIQSFGAILTKMVQRKIWDLQPAGVQEWLVQPLNVHDEIQCPTHPSMTDKLAEVVNATVESMKPMVPLLKMDWQSNLNSWADKS